MRTSPRRGWPFAGGVRGADDTGSLAMALLLTLVAISLSALLVPMVLTQIQSTRQESQRADALNAAQAGIDVAMGQIRAAVDFTGRGVIKLLPCGTLEGGLADGSPARWSVTVEYPDARCVPGGGTFNTPTRALMRSLGTAGTYTRSLQATYLFETTNGNVPGGPIANFDSLGRTDLCMDAGSNAPAAGTNLQTQWCSPGSPSQKFAYNQDLTISLVSSKTQDTPPGMCLEVAPTQAVGKFVQFQKCASPAKPEQMWSFNDGSRFVGTSDGTNPNNLCFTLQNPGAAGTAVVLADCGGSDDAQRLSPDATAGAGAAGPKSGQLVNFKQFGRCLDVNAFDVNATFHIVWPCKQAPDPSKVGWNQTWTVPAITGTATSASGTIVANDPARGAYCLQSPGSTAAMQYVTTAACPSGAAPANLTWTVFGKTDTYAESYVIKDAFGYCLSPNDATVDGYGSGPNISKVVVAVCNGSLEQKWNAPPNTQHSVLKDMSEK